MNHRYAMMSTRGLDESVCGLKKIHCNASMRSGFWQVDSFHSVVSKGVPLTTMYSRVCVYAYRYTHENAQHQHLLVPCHPPRPHAATHTHTAALMPGHPPYPHVPSHSLTPPHALLPCHPPHTHMPPHSLTPPHSCLAIHRAQRVPF